MQNPRPLAATRGFVLPSLCSFLSEGRPRAPRSGPIAVPKEKPAGEHFEAIIPAFRAIGKWAGFWPCYERRVAESSLVRALGLLLASCALYLGSTGCTSDCGEEHFVPFTGGKTDDARIHYMTSEAGGPYLHFPPSRVFELRHGLAAKPTEIQLFVAFSEFGDLAPSAGNQTVLYRTTESEAVTTEHIRVKNTTCDETFLFVSATAVPEPGSQDAGTDGS
jgi:hypothetical protein